MTCAVAGAVDPPGAYRTRMVQVLPVAPGPPPWRTVVDVHVPQVIEKVPPAGPVTLVMVGAAVNANGAVAAVVVAVLVTVIVPFFVPVPPEFNAGTGPL